MLQNIFWITGTFIFFAVVHSLTAGVALPNRLRKVLSGRLIDGWYRLIYNVFSLVTFSPIVVAMAIIPEKTLFAASAVLAWILRGVQVVALIGLAWSLWSIDFWRFAGLRQAAAYAMGDPLPLVGEPLQRRGIYSWIRHPLYFFSLIVLWANPVVTLNGLIFNICATLYFGIGAKIEERRLVDAYGETYETYRHAVSWLPIKPKRSQED